MSTTVRSKPSLGALALMLVGGATYLIGYQKSGLGETADAGGRKPLLGPTRRERASTAQRDRDAKKDSAQIGGERSTDEPREVHEKRANESDRGRGATSPWQMPWPAWKDILWRTYQQIGEDRLLAVAAGVVFYGLLALFPAVTALVSSYGLFTRPATIGEHLSFLSNMLPAGAFQIVQDQINRVVEKGDAKLSFGFLLGLGLALWSANAGMKAIIDALNVIYDEEEKRGFFKLNFVSLLLTLGGLVAILLAVGSIIVFPLILTRLGLGGMTEALATILRWPILLVLVMLGLAVLYRYAPSRTEPKWQWISVGSVVATLLWIAGSGALSYYLANFGNYDATYGSLGAAIGLMTWMWMSSIVILLGAELNSEIEHQTAHDTTEGGQKPLGARGAAMADTVGKAKT
jgi:membrane protein